MTTGHTPGPWRHEGTGIKARAFDGELKWITLVVHGANPTEATANRQLIASSPKMLAALRSAQRLIREALPKFDWASSALDANAIRLLNEVPSEISAVIAEATGGVAAILLLICLAVSPLSAQSVDVPPSAGNPVVPWVLGGLVIGSNAWDVGITHQAMRAGAAESAPIFGGSRLSVVYTVKAGTTAFEVWAIRKAWRVGLRKQAVVTTVVISAVHGTLAFYNRGQLRAQRRINAGQIDGR